MNGIPETLKVYEKYTYEQVIRYYVYRFSQCKKRADHIVNWVCRGNDMRPGEMVRVVSDELYDTVDRTRGGVMFTVDQLRADIQTASERYDTIDKAKRGYVSIPVLVVMLAVVIPYLWATDWKISACIGMVVLGGYLYKLGNISK